jgi:hypothetical protein
VKKKLESIKDRAFTELTVEQVRRVGGAALCFKQVGDTIQVTIDS